MPDDVRPIPFSRMVFLGDGETDIPCMCGVRDHCGHSIAVVKPSTKGAKQRAASLLDEGRTDFPVPADYRDGRALDGIVRRIIDKIVADQAVESLR